MFRGLVGTGAARTRAAAPFPGAVLLLGTAVLLSGCTSESLEAVRTGSASVVTAGSADPASRPTTASVGAGPPGTGPASTALGDSDAGSSTLRTTAPAPCPTRLTSSAPVTCLADEAVAAVVARLAVMPEMARFRLTDHRPVDDPVRERAATAAFIAAATARGVPYDVADAVIADQIEAATGVQQNLLAAWTGGGSNVDPSPRPSASTGDLDAKLRQRVDAASARIAAVLALVLPTGVPDGWQGAVELAQADLLPTLPDGVTALDLAVALRTLRDPTGTGNVLQE